MEALLRAIELIGSQAELARRLGVRPQLISQWTKGKRPLPPTRAAQIEELTGGHVTRADLLPNFPWVTTRKAD
jgi:DNA-binding transcriptional regulator YdaS (Cro superfamily)